MEGSESHGNLLEIVLDGYPLAYHFAGKSDLKNVEPEPGVDYSRKVFLTTNCPGCEKDWAREVYEQGLIFGLILALCPDCDSGENFTLVGNNKTWELPREQ